MRYLIIIAVCFMLSGCGEKEYNKLEKRAWELDMGTGFKFKLENGAGVERFYIISRITDEIYGSIEFTGLEAQLEDAQ